MSELETFRLTLKPDNLSYDITMVESVDGNQTKDAFSIAPPGLAPADNILLGVSGMEADIPIQWFIHDDGTDKANGTADGVSGFPSSTVVTLNEQILWLEEFIHDPDFGASWELSHIDGPRQDGDIPLFDDDEVFIESLDIPKLDVNSPKWLQARMGLRRGGSV